MQDSFAEIQGSFAEMRIDEQRRAAELDPHFHSSKIQGSLAEMQVCFAEMHNSFVEIQGSFVDN